ncbi:EAL and HDOD domain-containing protein [Dactylosporangium siamense]|uniref:EAL and HDOD domain-containing protein n=1 Tax=Dactylosporangium siamense TaxID=685454 RepID=UPI0019443E2D|nr:HDOD domain-containing protein [Dactylosporangium siamense]
MSEHAEAPGSGHVVHVARQPIYDRNGVVVADELLFRARATSSGADRSDSHATARVLVAAFTEFGLRDLSGGRDCFVNLTRDFLTGRLPLPFDGTQAVLEVLETTTVDDEVIAGVTALVEHGYTIALDDFVLGGGHEPLLPLASYVKIDLLHASEPEVRAAVAECRRHGHLRLVAERLETPDALRLAFTLGFELFQGDILGRPHVNSTVTLAPARLTRLRMLHALSADDVDMDEVVDLVGGDAALSLRLLRATNNAATGRARTVSSIRDTVVALGLNRIRQWVTLMLVADLTEADPEQLSGVLVRARFAQFLAGAVGLPGDVAYIGGLLSAIADLFDEPADRMLQGLPLDATLVDALTTGRGPLGDVLRTARAYMMPSAEMPPAGTLPAQTSVDTADMAMAYLSAIHSTNTTLAELTADV